MIDHDDYWGHSEILLRRLQPSCPEIDLRRAVSAAYYGLFHALSNESASLVTSDNAVLRNQVRRSFNHRTMRSVCDTLVRGQSRALPPPYDRLMPETIDPYLFAVAEAFVELQEARHTADYDLQATFSRNEATRLTALASNSWNLLRHIRQLPETLVFLTALLLADRWTRGG